MRFDEKSLQKRNAALRMKEMRSAQGEYDKFLAEKAAFESGAEKTGGFLGFGGEYAPNVGKDGSPVTPGAGLAGAAKGVGIQLAGQAASQALGGSDTLAGGMAEGAAMGAAFGPWGAGIGAAVGGLKGALGAKAAKKARQREAAVAFHQAESEIAGQRGQREQDALAGLQRAFTASLIRPSSKIF